MFKVSYALEKKILYYSPLDFYWVEKKGVPKAMFII